MKRSISKTLYQVLILIVVLVILIIFWQFKVSPALSPVTPTATSTSPKTVMSDSWKIFSDSTTGVTFRYPESVPANYINAVDWPPKVQTLNSPIVCTEGGTSTARGGATHSMAINGHIYCVTEESGAAAGSVYNQYAYGRVINDNKEVFLFFSLQFPQCANYPEPQKTDCQNAQSSFKIDPMVDMIFQSMEFNNSAPDNRVPVTTSSGISGTVLVGPTCPVERNPPDPQCADRPLQTTLVVKNADETKTISSFSSDSKGHFKITLPAGDYVIRSAPSQNRLPTCSSDLIKVTANTYTNTTVNCDSGIR